MTPKLRPSPWAPHIPLRRGRSLLILLGREDAWLSASRARFVGVSGRFARSSAFFALVAVCCISMRRVSFLACWAVNSACVLVSFFTSYFTFESP